MLDFIAYLFNDYTLRTVILGTTVLGFVSGILGSFAVLRKQSLLGDAISHAALPGIAMVFLLTHSKQPLLLLLGAIAAGWCGTILLMMVSYNTALKRDAILGIVLSVFFGFGLVLLTYIQKLPVASKSGLNTYLFGNASTMLGSDVVVMSGLGILSLFILWLFWKEFKVFTFDVDFATTLGFPIKRLDILLTTLIVVAIVIGLQVVGVVLMSAMIIAPASAARQWTDRLSVMVFLSGSIGASSGVVGALISSMIPNLPTGPTIVLVVSIVVVISLLGAPNRGLVASWVRQQRNRHQVRSDTMLCNMLLFSESHTDPYHAHELGALKAIGRASMMRTIKDLEKEGLVYNPERNVWGLTKEGYKRAKSLTSVKENH